MKNNLDYYSHKVVSHNHWKFKVLRRKYGWEGEGKFWALNNMIAEADFCKLDLTNEMKRLMIATELDFEPEDFTAFLDYLTTKCKLLNEEFGIYCTDNTQENFKLLDDQRTYKREWMKKSRDREPHDNHNKNVEIHKEQIELNLNGNENQNNHVDPIKESKVKQSKVNKREREVKVGNENGGNNLNGSPQNNLSISPHPLEKKYKSFTDWCRQHAASVFKLEFITIEEYGTLLQRFNSEAGKKYLQQKLKEMHNTKNLSQKYNNAYLTLTKWIEMDGDLIKNKFLQNGSK